jgi:hypothetical protein
MRCILRVARIGASLVALLLHPHVLDAQYFGRNKVRGDKFDFRILQAPHFDAYHYAAESLATTDAARMAERWYARLSAILGHEFKRRPLVFYADHPDSQQTNILSDLISQGTGGVTESARSRVIMPFTSIYAENDHVLGHELVHVFQYDIADTLSRTRGAKNVGLNALPLWFIEGMAEYLSVGRNDAHTAMWLRDAVLRNDLPTIGQLTRSSRRRRLGPTGQIALSGARGGISDIYLLDPSTARVRQLTNDRFADLQPAWSPDGRTIAFASDRGSTDFDRLMYGPMQLATIDVAACPLGECAVRTLQVFHGAKHLTPQFAPDGRSLFFVSDPDGISNVYRVSLSDGATHQITRLATGVTGITALSPALTVAARSGEMVFSVFDNSGQFLVRLSPDTAGGAGVAQRLASRRVAGVLPPLDPTSSRVAAYLADPTTGFPEAGHVFLIRPYRARFGLEYIGAPSIGVAFGGYGVGVGGAVQAFFSDMLNDRLIGATLFSGGSVRDIGGSAMYLSQGRRLNWLVGAAHIPYLIGDTTLNVGGGGVPGLVYEQQLARLYVDQASITAQYPLSPTRRFEAGISANRQSIGVQSLQTLVVGGQVVRQQESNDNVLQGVNYGQATVAYVGDYSTFGFTSPIAGGRYRFEVSPVFGGLSFGTLLAELSPLSLCASGHGRCSGVALWSVRRGRRAQ